MLVAGKDIDIEMCRRGMYCRNHREVVLKDHGFTAVCYCRDASIEQKQEQDRVLLHGDIYTTTDMDSICKSPYRLYDILSTSDGNYAFACINTNANGSRSGSSIAFARDPLGSRPLYYDYDNSSIVVASDRRVLCNYLEVEPGVLYVFNSDSSEIERIRFSPLEYKPCTDAVDVSSAVEHTRYLIMKSIARRLARSSKMVVGVSGIDSIILAVLSTKHALNNVIPVTVCTKGSYDEMNAKYIRERTGLDIHLLILDEQDILNILDDLSTLNIDIDFTSVMDLSIACVVYALSEFARDNGMDTLMLGQLADELFGGYARYMRYASIHGLDLNTILFNDVKSAMHDLCRDDSIASSMLVDLVLPYASTELVSYVVNLPAKFKVDMRQGTRKLLLRMVAESIGIAHDVAYKEKKAMQFSTGIFKLVKRLVAGKGNCVRHT